MNLLVVLTSVAAFLAKGTDGLYLVKQQESASVVNPGIEWSRNGGSQGSDGSVLRRAPVENLAPQKPPGRAVVGLPMLRNVTSDPLQLSHAFLIWMSRLVYTPPGLPSAPREKTFNSRFLPVLAILLFTARKRCTRVIHQQVL